MCSPDRVVLFNRFYQGNERCPIRAHTRVRPYGVKEIMRYKQQ